MLLCVILALCAGVLAAPPEAARAEEAGPDSEVEWAAVLINGKKAGHAKHVRTVEDGKVTTTEIMSVALTRAGIEIAVTELEEAAETLDGRPLSFRSEQAGAGMGMKITGTVSPQGKITATIETAGATRTRTLDWPEGALMFEGMRLKALEMGLREGTTYAVKLFMASSLRPVVMEVEVGKKANVELLGRVAPLTEVKQTVVASGARVPATAYVDDRMSLRKIVMSFMGVYRLEMVACSKEVALSENDPTDFFTDAFAEPPRRLEPTELSTAVTYTIAPKVGETTLTIPASDEQTVEPTEENHARLTVTRLAPKADVPFPYDGADDAAAAALRPNQYIQSDMESVRDLAKEAVGDATDAATAARRIESFVGRYIRDKNLSVGYATAAEVVDGKEGDCTEHAILAAAMCRSAGIPARIATGLAYVAPDDDSNGAFWPHAWMQAYVGGKWISFDPALGEFDAGHIMLGFGNGDPLDFFSLVNTLGNLRIVSVESSR